MWLKHCAATILVQIRSTPVFVGFFPPVELQFDHLSHMRPVARLNHLIMTSDVGSLQLTINSGIGIAYLKKMWIDKFGIEV